MQSANYDFILKDLLSAHDGTSSDNRYVLRKMLVRGSSEAIYRSRVNDGNKAFAYKLMMYVLEDLLENLSDMLDIEGRIISEYHPIIIEALKDCQCLIAIDQTGTNADYNNLIACLTDDHCEECRETALAA